jgi:hypothetical protein
VTNATLIFGERLMLGQGFRPASVGGFLS